MKKFLLLWLLVGYLSSSQVTLKLAELSNLVYFPNKIVSEIPSGELEGFNLIHKLYDEKTGFGAIAYIDKYSKEVMIAYRGTSNKKDIVADIAIANIAVFNSEKHSATEIMESILNDTLIDANLPTLLRILNLSSLIYSKIENKIDKYQIISAVKEMDKFLAWELENDEKTWSNYLQTKAKREKRLMKLLSIFTRQKRKIKPLEHLKTNLQVAIDFYLETQKKVSKQYPKENFNYSITGHSLGGGYAQIVGATYAQKTETFAAPGMEEIFVVFFKKPPQMHTIKNHMHRHDLVPKVGKHIGQVIVYNNPQLNDEELVKKQKRLQQFVEELPQKMYKKIRRNLWSKLVNIKNVDAAISKAQKKSQDAYFKSNRSTWNFRLEYLQFAKQNIEIHNKLLQKPWQERLSYLQENKLVSKYNRNEIMKYEVVELFHLILHNHSMEQYILTLNPK
ncbi:hypothetical protein [Candidatus Uabimicrobium sp. HlEnr_7]|uniref:lipase family protein n=1 Tax=Candidatus Uabimicrobium helgolandensis TaxID=3095367 RepID=UPI003557D9E1